MTLEEFEALISEQIEVFNERVRNDPNLQKELEGVVRSIHLDLEDDLSYILVLKDGAMGGFEKGTPDTPEIVITSTSDTLVKVLKKELSVMKAVFITKKIKIDASLEDKLRLRKLFS